MHLGLFFSLKHSTVQHNTAAAELAPAALAPLPFLFAVGVAVHQDHTHKHNKHPGLKESRVKESGILASNRRTLNISRPFPENISLHFGSFFTVWIHNSTSLSCS